MEPVTVGIGLFALVFGGYTVFLRATDPSKLKKLKAMQDVWGERSGFVVHMVAYSLVPIGVGVAMILAGLRGISLF